MLASSVVFYASYSLAGLPILFATSLAIWFFAIRIQAVSDAYESWLKDNRKSATKEERKERKGKATRSKRLLVIAIVVVVVGNLALCKYYTPFALGINNLMNWHLWTAEGIIVPLGISYYSLQLVGYLLDVHRDIVKAERNPLKVFLFSSLFLAIMQGPFNRYGDLMPQVCDEPKMRKRPVWKGRALVRILGGYLKKMCIADQVAILTAEIFGHYH